VDRYYQFARCYRDESGRGDRQPEFTQIDLELSFVTQREIQTVVEGLVARMWAAAAATPALPGSAAAAVPTAVPSPPFARMAYAEAMARFGSDKPDLRFGMELRPVAPAARAFDIGDAAAVAALGPAAARAALLEDLARHAGPEAVVTLADAAGGVTVTVAAAAAHASSVAAGRARLAAAAWLEARGVAVRPPGLDKFLWVEDFPLFERDDATGRLQSTHHPFTAPVPEDAALLYTAPERVRAQHFDLVVNGVELGGGSVRVHHAPTQEYILGTVLGEDLALFEQLLEGLRYGAPPHGGLALGFDRVLMILARAASLRDVLAFPKSFAGKDLMAGVPGPLSAADLALYHLKQ
jgi:aspartyl-tRNA synthetase